MSESHAERQVRLLLEGSCSKAMRGFLMAFGPRCAVTLVVYDYGGGPGVKFSNLAYCTSLPPEELVALLEARVRRWECGAPEFFTELRPGEWLPDLKQMRVCADWLRDWLPESVGFSLFCGSGERSQYIAHGDRDGCLAMFKNDMLPGLREQGC